MEPACALSALVLTPSLAAATPPGPCVAPCSVTLPTAADTFIEEKNPNNTAGGGNDIKVKDKTNDQKRGLGRFDLTGLPTGPTVSLDDATMSFNVTGNKNGLMIGVHEVTSAWVEADASWNERNSGTN